MYWKEEEYFTHSGTRLSHLGDIVLVNKWRHHITAYKTNLELAGLNTLPLTTSYSTNEPHVSESDVHNPDVFKQELLESDEQQNKTSTSQL